MISPCSLPLALCFHHSVSLLSYIAKAQLINEQDKKVKEPDRLPVDSESNELGRKMLLGFSSSRIVVAVHVLLRDSQCCSPIWKNKQLPRRRVYNLPSFHNLIREPTIAFLWGVYGTIINNSPPIPPQASCVWYAAVWFLPHCLNRCPQWWGKPKQQRNCMPTHFSLHVYKGGAWKSLKKLEKILKNLKTTSSNFKINFSNSSQRIAVHKNLITRRQTSKWFIGRKCILNLSLELIKIANEQLSLKFDNVHYLQCWE